MTVSSLNHWLEANQRYLMAALAQVRQLLEQQTETSGDRLSPITTERLEAMAAEMKVAPALETLCQLFNLSPFERQLLLLCAGVELEGEIASLCARLQVDSRKDYATFSLALAALPHSHWSAIYPASPLRHWCLLELGNSDGITRSPLRIDERVLHYLTGGQDLDERLVGLVQPVPVPEALVPSHRLLAEQLIAAWSWRNERLATVQLYGADRESQQAIAAAACAMLGINLHGMSAQLLPLEARELEAFIRLWSREVVLSNTILFLDCQELNASDAARQLTVQRLIAGLSESGAGTWFPRRRLGDFTVGLVVCTRERKTWGERPTLTLNVRPPTTQEQYELWQRGLGRVIESPNGTVSALVTQYKFNASTIHAVCTEALGRMAVEVDGSEVESPKQGENSKIQNLVWDICRSQSRPRLEDLAQRIEPAATWDDLVLPPMQRQILQEIAVHVRQQLTVYETWGFASKGTRGLGISALFTGVSGTGKTMAAEVLANELRLELYRIDLSSVVSKYIGETEKNLRQVFDAAEQGGVVLLFDEADALFGKRSEVKDSRDRYANIEVSYLLQRMEAYRGLAILTTNLKNALDTAFMRRIRFIVQFPFPDVSQRGEIWQRVFPSKTPTEGLEVEKLARLNISGGNIRNIALYAAFLAAEAHESVQMRHLLRSAQVEFTKLEKTLTAAETKGWV